MMTIYKGVLSGQKKARFVKAKGLREAQNHFVTLTSLTADEVEELIGGEQVVERAGEPAPNDEIGTMPESDKSE